MSEAELAEIEARANAANPGTWRHYTDGRIFAEMGYKTKDLLVAERVCPPNGEFICHAHDDIPALIASFRAARAALKGLVDQLDLVHNSPEYIGVWTLSQLHNGYYNGPFYTDALAAARAALKSE